MIKFGKGVVKFRIPILILAFILLIPAGISYLNTRVNYDILSYLPGEIDTMKGQDVLLDEFGTGAFSFVILEDMPNKNVDTIAKEIESIDHVKDVLWYGSVADFSIPVEMLPTEVYEFFNYEGKTEDATTGEVRDTKSQLMVVLYDDGMASDGVMAAIEKMTKIVDEGCYVSGMAAVIDDTKNLSEKETPIYVGIAVILALVILSLTMDSALVPLLFLASIGMAIVYNLGTNFNWVDTSHFFNREISYVTQALAAVLQLAVTMDYSIFLWHSYEENQEKYGDDKHRAMAHAISQTITSVVGSSITTVAGFVALCFMSFTLGLDLGIVMAKGVVFGVIGCVTVLPSMILVCDKALVKTRHKAILPDLGIISNWVVKHYPIFLVLFLVILGPAIYGYTHTNVYYDLAGTLPDSLLSKQANDKLDAEYSMGATHMIIAPSDMDGKEVRKMMERIEDVKGVKMAVALDTITGYEIPEEVVPDRIKDNLKSGDYQLMLVTSEYAVASDEINAQIDEISKITEDYYDTSATALEDRILVIGEGPCTKDLITITDSDFKRVSAISIIAIFIIIALVFKSISLPVILVAVIEFGIFINMGLPYYTHTTLPFIASIVIGTIQLGATVDYAILMTNKYKRNRSKGMEKKEAVAGALQNSVQSVVVSALTFFAATFGVGLYSNIDMIGSLCMLMARGAIISMFVVIFVLPSMFMIFDKIIVATSMGFREKNR